MTIWHMHHVGILVKDIHAGIEHFGAMLGLDFGEPATVHLDMEQAGERVTHELTYSHSVQGPPHIELLQCTADGIWGLQHGEGLHHVGGRCADLGPTVERLLAEGHALDARIFLPDGTLATVYAARDHPHAHNTRIELMGLPEPPRR
jgi:hypothetical protein